EVVRQTAARSGEDVPPEGSGLRGRSGDNVEGGRQLEPPEHRKCPGEDAPVRVVEGQGRGAAYAASGPDPRDQLTDAQHVVLAGDPLGNPREVVLLHVEGRVP